MRKNKDYLNQYKLLHKTSKFGMSSGREEIYQLIKSVIDESNPRTVLDFGCGQSPLIDQLAQSFNNIRFYKYDPGIEEYSKILVTKVDLVICTDVLEHIPEENLQEVVKKIRSLTDKIFFIIALVWAQRILPNGENAHCTVKSGSWWKTFLREFFDNIAELPVLLLTNIPCLICKTWKDDLVKKDHHFIFYKTVENIVLFLLRMIGRLLFSYQSANRIIRHLRYRFLRAQIYIIKFLNWIK